MVEWRERSEVLISPARLTALTQDASLLATDRPPPLHQLIRFRPDSPKAKEWAEAFVVANDRPERVVALLRRF
jgi:hypothetical protein